MLGRALLGSLLCGSLLGCGSVYHVDEDPPDAAQSGPDAAHPVDGRAVDGTLPEPGPALVQSVSRDASGSGTLMVSFTQQTSAGDLLVMFGATNATDLMTVTGGAEKWTNLETSTKYANLELWFAVADGSTGPIEIERNDGGPNNEIWMDVSEWSGVQPTSPVANAAGDNTGTTIEINPGAITLGGSSLVLFGFTSGSDDGFGTLSSPWSSFGAIDGPMVAQRTFYQVVDVPAGPAQAIDPTVSFANGGWDAAVVAFPVR